MYRGLLDESAKETTLHGRPSPMYAPERPPLLAAKTVNEDAHVSSTMRQWMHGPDFLA
jgi:hypothetical protein